MAIKCKLYNDIQPATRKVHKRTENSLKTYQTLLYLLNVNSTKNSTWLFYTPSNSWKSIAVKSILNFRTNNYRHLKHKKQNTPLIGRLAEVIPYDRIIEYSKHKKETNFILFLFPSYKNNRLESYAKNENHKLWLETCLVDYTNAIIQENSNKIEWEIFNLNYSIICPEKPMEQRSLTRSSIYSIYIQSRKFLINFQFW